jgi:lipooligosaccharide transport system permease protein
MLTAPAFRELEYWLMRYRRTWRGSIVVSVVNPLLFLTAMGVGLGRLVDGGAGAGPAGTTYMQYIVPGVLAAAVMQTMYLEASGPVLQSVRGRGNYRAATATPLRPADVVAGHLMYWTLRALLTAALFIAVAAAFGTVEPARAALLVPCAALLGCAFAAPAAAWAVTARRPAALNAVFRFVILPMYMFSGTFFPVERLPAVLRALVHCTPLWHGVDLCRAVALGTADTATTLMHIAYLTALTAAGIIAARRTYTKTLRV